MSFEAAVATIKTFIQSTSRYVPVAGIFLSRCYTYMQKMRVNSGRFLSIM